MPRTRAITGPLTSEIDRLAESLMSQIPIGRLIFMNPGSPNGAIAGECGAVRNSPWFSVLAHRLGVIYHADNLWARQTAGYLMEEVRGHQITYIQIPGLIPFLTIPSGPEMEAAAVKVALENLVRAVEDGFEAALLLAELPMVVITQLHVKSDVPPTLPLAIADALNLDDPFVRMIEEARLGPCHAVELTINKAFIHAA